MNIILVQTEEIQGNCVQLSDHRAEHIVKVLRAEVGARVKVGCIDGPIGTGDIVSIKKKYPFKVELKVDLADGPRPQPHLDLILALPRPIMLKRILSQVTALGVGTIHLVNAKRVEKSFWGASSLILRSIEIIFYRALNKLLTAASPQLKFMKSLSPLWKTIFQR